MRVFTLALAVVCLAPMAAGAADLLYVSLDNNTVVRYDVSLGTPQAIENSKQVVASTNLNGPQGLVFDTAGNLYVANMFGNSISKFNSSGVYQSSIGSSATLNRPRGLVIDTAGSLYAANWRGNNSIVKFNSTSGAYVTTFTPGLSFPIGLAFDSAGYLYASDDAGWILKINSTGTAVFSIGSNLAAPNGLAFDISGNLYAANFGSNSVSKFNPSGEYLTSIGSFPDLQNPTGLALDASSNLYVANTGEGTISKFNSSGQLLLKWSTGVGVSPSFVLFVPEPSTYVLSTLASLTLAILARRRSRTDLA